VHELHEPVGQKIAGHQEEDQVTDVVDHQGVKVIGARIPHVSLPEDKLLLLVDDAQELIAIGGDVALPGILQIVVRLEFQAILFGAPGPLATIVLRCVVVHMDSLHDSVFF